MRVARVRIENFKKFEHLDVALRPLDCLVGANNSGKTTLLQALALFDFCVHHCLERRNGDLELKRRTIAPEDFYVLPVTHPMDLWHDRRAMQGKKQRKVVVAVEFDDGAEVQASVKLDFNRYGISVDVQEDSQELLRHLETRRIAYLPVFSSFLPREERRTPAAIKDELGHGRVHVIVRNLLLDLRNVANGDRVEELTGILRRSFPGLEDLEIRFDEVSDRHVRVEYREQGRPKSFDIFSAGSGFQQFLYLFGFILLQQPTTLLLDEPDVHLHGSLQQVLLGELRRLVADGRQVLFATHSRELIARVSPEDILSLDESGPRRLQVAFDVYDALDRLGSLDPTQLAVVQAYRRVVVVEDHSDRRLLSIFCGKVLGPEMWSQVERRLAFCYSKGNPWKQHDLDRLQSMLQQIVAVSGAALRMFVVADRDYHPEPVALEAKLSGPNVEFHVWRRCEIENYLLHPDALRRILRDESDKPVLEETLLIGEFGKLVEESRSRADDGLVQAYDDIRKRESQHWNAAAMSRMAREYLDAHWDAEKLALADAKETVLPGIKRWLQERGLDSFSDHHLAESLRPEELPDEVHDVARRLAEFAGVAIP